MDNLLENNKSHIEWDTEEIKKLPDKECCLVCAIILSLNAIFVGAMIYLINNEGLDGSIS
jgi:hypothetical protein